MEDQPKIVMLSQDVINQIAAGEVIHQPINVVKELFENALDANATKVEINLQNGGFSLIQIIDDGCGISKQDLPNVCLRHSTSKIHQFIDLTTKLSTFGFRGEALFSMSCVSHLSIITKTENSDIALLANYENGQMIGTPEPVSSINGTTVEVRDIFYNKPEKIRAIPDSSSQNRQVLQMATQYSLAYPHVSIIVNLDGKERLHTFGNTNTESVLGLIYGLTAGTAFFKVEAEFGHKIFANLFLGTIASTRTMKGSAIFVNNRLVRCEKVKRAMEMVYSEFLKKGDKPFFIVMLTIPPKYVDVNVHPTKRDVNFENSQVIIERLSNIVRDHLSERISGKTFKQKSNSEQLTFENSISSHPIINRASRKKKEGIEMQIQGSVQSSIITSPQFTADSTTFSSQEKEDIEEKENIEEKDDIEEKENIEEKDDIEEKKFNSQPTQSIRQKSRNSIFEELRFTGFDKSIETKSQPNNTKDTSIDSHMEDQYFFEDSQSIKQSIDLNSQEDEEKESDITQKDNKKKSPKKRRFGLNLQPLSQNPPKSSICTNENSQPPKQMDTSSINFFSQKTAKSRTKSLSIFDDLKYEPDSTSKLTRGDPRERTIEQMFSLSAAMSNSKSNGNEDEDDDDELHSQYRDIEIESIQELRENEKKEVSKELCSLFSKSILVGTIKLKFVLFSSDDTLYMCDLFGLTRLFFYQLLLRHFGNYGKIKFQNAIDLYTVIGEINFHAENIVDILNQHAEMLDDYFRIKIRGRMLISMPDILPGYEPSFSALPLFFNRLATEINWEYEYDCIFGILDELSMLYAIHDEDSTDDELENSMKKMIANVIMPEIKTEAFMPNETLISNGSLKRLKSASEMYKIFERT